MSCERRITIDFRRDALGQVRKSEGEEFQFRRRHPNGPWEGQEGSVSAYSAEDHAGADGPA